MGRERSKKFLPANSMSNHDFIFCTRKDGAFIPMEMGSALQRTIAVFMFVGRNILIIKKLHARYASIRM